jgi:uncharacterized protein (TIGR02271 family)
MYAAMSGSSGSAPDRLRVDHGQRLRARQLAGWCARRNIENRRICMSNQTRFEIQPGTVVRSADGEKLGKVVSCEQESFTIEKGLFFRKDYLARYEDIASIDEGEIRLTRNRDDLIPVGDGGDYEHVGAEGTTAAMGGAGDASSAAAATHGQPVGMTQETRIPVAEEQLNVSKHAEQAGAVHVQKRVITERKTIEVPVTREEVEVERVPASRTSEAAASETAFREVDVTIPVMEEEIEVQTRPVVKEEVVVRKTAYEEQRAASADTRREEVDVDTRGDANKSGGSSSERLVADEDPDKRRA